jgi:hypothetical protein
MAAGTAALAAPVHQDGAAVRADGAVIASPIHGHPGRRRGAGFRCGGPGGGGGFFGNFPHSAIGWRGAGPGWVVHHASSMASGVVLLSPLSRPARPKTRAAVSSPRERRSAPADPPPGRRPGGPESSVSSAAPGLLCVLVVGQSAASRAQRALPPVFGRRQSLFLFNNLCNRLGVSMASDQPVGGPVVQGRPCPSRRLPSAEGRAARIAGPRRPCRRLRPGAGPDAPRPWPATAPASRCSMNAAVTPAEDPAPERQPGGIRLDRHEPRVDRARRHQHVPENVDADREPPDGPHPDHAPGCRRRSPGRARGPEARRPACRPEGQPGGPAPGPRRPGTPAPGRHSAGWRAGGVRPAAAWPGQDLSARVLTAVFLPVACCAVIN